MFSGKPHFGLSKPTPENVNAALYADGNAYLHELCRINASPSLIREAVLELGAGLDVRNKKDMTALGIAIQYGNAEVVRCLLDLGSEIYFEIDKARSFNALFLAVYTGQEQIVKVLLENQADICVNKSGMTPEGKPENLPCLHMAIKLGRMNMIKPLIGAGAFLGREAGSESLTPLMLAAHHNLDTAIAWLLSAGAELNQKQSSSGMTALHYAVTQDRPIAARKLIEAGADVNAVTDTGLTSLMMAVSNGNLSLTCLLLEHGADIDAQRSPGNRETALMQAASRHGNVEVVRALLNAGANPLLTDIFNRTAAKHAESSHVPAHHILIKEAESRAEQSFFEKRYRKHKP